jgi:hypothetical protein
MKQISFSFLFLLSTHFCSAQTFNVLPSKGFQVTKFTSISSFVTPNVNSQNLVVPTSSILLYRTNDKGRGLMFGATNVSRGVKIEYDVKSATSLDFGTNNATRNVLRLELGYQFITKKLHFNRFLGHSDLNKKDKRFFIQVQPYATLGYETSRAKFKYSTILDYPNSNQEYIARRNISFNAGGNIYFGKGDRRWFFININKSFNLNEGDQFSKVSTNSNGYSTNYTISNIASGFSFSVGVPISLNFNKKRK